MNTAKVKKVFQQNGITNWREIEGGKTILSSKPRRLNVALSTRCNLTCRMCEVRKVSWELPFRVVSEIMEFFPYLEGIIWQGGEVFLLDYFKGVLEEAARYPHLRHEITTSGLLITEEWLERLSRIKIDLNLSIDGVNKETYEYIRRGSSFKDLLKVLELLGGLKASGKKQVLVLIVTVMASNYRQLERFVDFAHRYKFDRLILQPVKGNYENQENIFFRNDREALTYIARVKPGMKKRAAEYGIELVEWLPEPSCPAKNIPGQVLPRKGNGLFCHAPWQQLFIEWGGRAYPHCLCLQDGPNENKEVGNVLSSTLGEIWNGQRIQLFRRKIIANELSGLCNPDCLQGLVAREVRNLPRGAIR